MRTPVQHIDLVPTILALIGQPAPSSLRGRSLAPLLSGTGPIADEAIYSEALYARYHFDWSELVALTDPRYRYIKAPHDELYDLDRDPHEIRNLNRSRTYAATRERLRRELRRLVTEAVGL